MGQKKLTQTEEAELAVERYSSLSESRRPKKYAALVDALKRQGRLRQHINPSEKTVERAIRNAFAEGTVEIVRTGIIQSYKRNAVLEKRLAAAFGLKRAIVVALDPNALPQPPNEQALSDIIHEQLGHALAHQLTEADRLIRSGDTIGVGGGRAVHSTIAVLSRQAKVAESDISILSLTGSTPHGQTVPQSILLRDADQNAMRLAQCFSGAVHTYPIQRGIVCLAKDDRTKAVHGTKLDERSFAKMSPTLAIVGIGVLNRGHYFQKFVEQRRAEQVTESEDDPRYVFAQLRKWSNLVEQSGRHAQTDRHYFPVAEICGSFFRVDPPPGFGGIVDTTELRSSETDETPSDDWWDEIRSGIDETNVNLVTPTLGQLCKFRTIAIAAGTEEKAFAIVQALNLLREKSGDEPQDVWLCTDEGAAKIMLARDYNHA